MKFAGIKDNKICVITDSYFKNDNLQVIEVPKELLHLSNSDLMINCRFENGEIISKLAKKQAHKMKIAFVTNWGEKCGISTYGESLFPEISKYVGDFKLFVETNDIQTDNSNKFGEQILLESQIISCWKRGESLQALVKELKEYSPDIIIISHEFGLFFNSRYWLSLMTQLENYRVIVIMHSVFHHKDKSIFEAAMPEIIVHLDQAKDVLKNEKHIQAKINVVPHGCYPIINQEKLWNNYKSKHTFIQQGFGFTYKNFEDAIKATALLKTKYSDIFFTGLFSESPYNKSGHDIYYNKLMNLIDELNIQDNVSIIRGFQSDQVVDSYLRSNEVAVFPYISVVGHEVFGASGAARGAMAAGLPIITSNIPHFSDLPSIKADSAEQIANELDKLFSNNLLKIEQISKQNQFILENSWNKIAEKYIKIFEN